jgi:hypothetical protein
LLASFQRNIKTYIDDISQSPETPNSPNKLSTYVELAYNELKKIVELYLITLGKQLYASHAYSIYEKLISHVVQTYSVSYNTYILLAQLKNYVAYVSDIAQYLIKNIFSAYAELITLRKLDKNPFNSPPSETLWFKYITEDIVNPVINTLNSHFSNFTTVFNTASKTIGIIPVYAHLCEQFSQTVGELAQFITSCSNSDYEILNFDTEYNDCVTKCAILRNNILDRSTLQLMISHSVSIMFQLRNISVDKLMLDELINIIKRFPDLQKMSAHIISSLRRYSIKPQDYTSVVPYDDVPIYCKHLNSTINNELIITLCTNFKQFKKTLKDLLPEQITSMELDYAIQKPRKTNPMSAHDVLTSHTPLPQDLLESQQDHGDHPEVDNNEEEDEDEEEVNPFT